MASNDDILFDCCIIGTAVATMVSFFVVVCVIEQFTAEHYIVWAIARVRHIILYAILFAMIFECFHDNFVEF